MDPEAVEAINALLKHQWELSKSHIERLSTEKKRNLKSILTFEEQRGLLLSALNQLPTNKDFSNTVASLFDESLAHYIYIHIDVAIPYALQLPVMTTNTTNTTLSCDSVIPLLEAIASVLFMSTHALYADYGYLAIVHCLLIPPACTTRADRQNFLDRILTLTDATATRLLQGHVTRVTSLLAVELWQPDHQHVLDGLNQVKIWSGYEMTSLEYFLRAFMLSILNHINQQLSHSTTTNSTKGQHLLTSLTALLDIIGPEALIYIPQLLLIAKTVTSICTGIGRGHYGDAYCLLWNRLLSLSACNAKQQNTRYFNEVVRGIIPAFPLCDRDIRSKLADDLTQAIKSHILEQPATRMSILTLTQLTPYPEFQSLRQWIEEEEHHEVDDNDTQMQESSIPANSLELYTVTQQRLLKELIIHMAMDEVVPSFDSLQQLRRLLSKEQHIFFTPGNTNETWPLLGELYDLLLRTIQQNAYRHDIYGLAVSCLGLVGAIDPSRLSSAEERQDTMLKFKMVQQQQYDNDRTATTMNATRYSNEMIVLENYTDFAENQAFAIHLIVHYIIPIFHTTTTSASTSVATDAAYTNNSANSILDCSQYTIQEILKAVGITVDSVLGKRDKGKGRDLRGDRRKLPYVGRHHEYGTLLESETRELWWSLDPMIRDVIQPLLRSKFEVDVQFNPRDPPLYTSAGNSFEEWVKLFYYFLLEKVNATADMTPIFNACVPSVEAGHSVLTQHLIPFLVLRVLLSSSSSSSSYQTATASEDDYTPKNQPDAQLILDEIIGVLENDSFGVDMKQRTLQMVVSITSHCQLWIRQKLQLKKKQLKFTSSMCRENMEIYTVKTFLTKIPNGLMTKAAFRTGNYPQAMMHFELFLKEMKEQQQRQQQQQQRQQQGQQQHQHQRRQQLLQHQQQPKPLPNEYLDAICQTYMELEGSETMPEILSKFDPPLTPQLEILRFESSGDWHLAKRVYEDLLPKNITSMADQEEEASQLLGRYFNCLRHLNDYGSIINYANGMLDNTSSTLILEQVNTYRAEAAWKSANWKLLHECLKLPMDDSFEASIARALAYMQSENPSGVHLTLEQAKSHQAKLICHENGGGVVAPSYQKSYDSVLRLQLLQEIDSIMMEKAGRNAAPIDDDITAPTISYDPFLLWRTKFSKVKPSYTIQRQLLDLRMVAEFDIWKTGDMIPYMSDTEKELRLLLSKTALKAKDMDMAFGSIYRDPLSSEPSALIQLVKWNLERKDLKTCNRYLNDRQVASLPKGKYMLARLKETQYNMIMRKTLTPLRYNDEMEKINALYSDVRKSMPNWEKIFHVSGSFLEQAHGATDSDPIYFTRAAEAIQYYCEALKLGSRYYYSTMPRLLSLWLRISEQMQRVSSGKLKFNDEMVMVITKSYSSTNQTISDNIDQIPPYLFGLALPRLVSRLTINDSEVVKILSKMIVKVLISYPRSTIWSLQYALRSDDSNVGSITNNILRQAEALQPNSLVTSVIQQTDKFTRHLEQVAKYKRSNISSTVAGGKSAFETKFPELMAMKNLNICIPQETAMLPSLPESLSSAPTPLSDQIEHLHEPYPTDLPTIVRILPTVQVMSSLQQPKRLSFLASDGKTYDFLCKSNDELRKDARMMEFCHMINKFLIKNATSRQQQLYIRTYAVIPLGVRWGLIEWINNLHTLKSIVCDLWEAHDSVQGSDQLNKLRQIMKTGQERSKCTVEDKVETLVYEIYPKSPVVFASWFLDTFPEPSEWFVSRSRYVRTLAVMSIVGHVLGLGDRHAENIMFDATSGDTVHVDVNMLFDHGQDLAVPETVPFRLTRNLVDAMGVAGETGLFRRACITTLEVLREHRPQLLSVFETFLYDPVDDRRKKDAHLTHEQTAKKMIAVIERKIQTKNPVKRDVDVLTKEALSNYNLAQMFFGWSAFI